MENLCHAPMAAWSRADRQMFAEQSDRMRQDDSAKIFKHCEKEWDCRLNLYGIIQASHNRLASFQWARLLFHASEELARFNDTSAPPLDNKADGRANSTKQLGLESMETNSLSHAATQASMDWESCSDVDEIEVRRSEDTTYPTTKNPL